MQGFYDDADVQLSKAILVGVKLKDDHRLDLENSLIELAELANTAGIEVLCQTIQSRNTPDPAHFVGSGKIDELKNLADELSVDSIIFDNDLTPAQTRNIEEVLDLTVVDRTGLILIIFSQRAQTKSAKLQVDLAKLEYALPRLTRMWTHFSRQAIGGGGGSGPVRGAGETQLQVDRLLIRSNISTLKKRLKKVEQNRRTQRQNRDRLISVSLVGYTNAGKSTLFNRLTAEDHLAEDKLFATLDPTTRLVELGQNRRILLTDTVGFIKKLPHQLVEAFKATLEEVAESDLFFHVVDASHSQIDAHIEIVNEILKEIGAEDVPTILVFNKIDLISPEKLSALRLEYPKNLAISAFRGDGIDQLKLKIAAQIAKRDVNLEIDLSYHDAKALDFLYKNGQVIESEYRSDQIKISATIPKIYLKTLEQLLSHSVIV